MNSKFLLGIILFLLGCANPVPYEEKWVPLFVESGEDYAFVGSANWVFDNGLLSATLGESAGYIVTNEEFRDFHLKLKFMPDDTVNSGVFIRCKKDMYSAGDCYELNIWDAHTNQDYRTGAIVTRTKPMKIVETINKWNTYEIIAKDNHIIAWVNGIKIADLTDSQMSSGHIALQMAGGGSIKFKNISIKSL